MGAKFKVDLSYFMKMVWIVEFVIQVPFCVVQKRHTKKKTAFFTTRSLGKKKW